MPSELPFDLVLLAVAVLLFTSVLTSKVSERAGIPALLLFLTVGMLAGSEGPGGIHFDDPGLAQALGATALTFILFAGGLDTPWARVRPVLAPGIALATAGVLGTALLVGVFAVVAMGFGWLEGCLLGAIVSSTDAPAVFAVLRARGSTLTGRLAPLLELESGSNDPMAVFLTIGLVQLIAVPGTGLADLVLLFVRQMLLGAVLGYVMGRTLSTIINRVQLQYEGLYPVLTMSMVLATYAGTATAGGSGFLAVYVAGLAMGTRNFIHRASLIRFHDGLAWLMQIAMFLTLGLLVFPSELPAVMPAGLALSVFLIVIARPVSVLALLRPAGFSLREQLMVGWVGLRGAVPIILATFPLVAGIPGSDDIFNLVFFIVLTSVLLQGTSLSRIARWLGVAAPAPRRRQTPFEIVQPDAAHGRFLEITIPAGSPAAGRKIVDQGLPPGTLIVLLSRRDEYLVPGGGTVLEEGDELLVLLDRAHERQVRMLLEGPEPR